MITLQDDKLERKEFIDDLFNIFENFSETENGGLTISINGKYGSGKSTLFDFIEERNQDENKYNIVRYNTWINNIFSNPLIPILYSLNELKSNKNKIKSCAKKVVSSIPKILINTLANAHSVDFSSCLNNDNIFDEYTEYKKSIKEYQHILGEYCESKNTIILIDELDRCLPEYQIKVLETLYNIFNIPGLILVIALDKDQLEYSIKNIFGNTKNVSGYLSKFIQYEIDLPEDKNNKYIETLINFNCKYPEIKKICAKMFEKAKISLRDSKQIVQELNLICNNKKENGETIEYIYWYPVFV